jgi:hypothetical protein
MLKIKTNLVFSLLGSEGECRTRGREKSSCKNNELVFPIKVPWL